MHFFLIALCRFLPRFSLLYNKILMHFELKSQVSYRYFSKDKI